MVSFFLMYNIERSGEKVTETTFEEAFELTGDKKDGSDKTEKVDIIGRFFPQSQMNLDDAQEVKKEQERFEKEEKEKAEENEKSWRRMKIGFGVFGGALTVMGGCMVVEMGAPRRDEDGGIIEDEYSDQPIVLQYLKRTWKELTFYEKAFMRKRSLDTHVRVVHDKMGPLRIFPCTYCGKAFGTKLSYKERALRGRTTYEWLRGRKVKAFYSGVTGFGFEQGARALLQASGVGRLAPNVLLMGYKSDWTTAPPSDLVAYFNVLNAAFENRIAVAILRVAGGLDYSLAVGEEPPASGLTATSSGSGDLRVRSPQIMHADSDLDIRSTDAPAPLINNL